MRFNSVCVAALFFLAALPSGVRAQVSKYQVIKERVTFPARIGERTFALEAMIYRPQHLGRHPLVIMSHGRDGIASPRDVNAVNGYESICRVLASVGYAVAYVVRRGYGNSEGNDVELQDTAVLSGLEAANDYRASVEYWRTREFVEAEKVVLIGQSQGGWAVLAATNVAIEGVLGVVNISGGTNYRSMGDGRVTPEVQNHWVAGCRELGANARVPSYWIYAENDLSISAPTARRMFDAFVSAGGVAQLLMLPPFRQNGHAVVEEPGNFMRAMLEFFASIGFVESVGIAPQIRGISGVAAMVPNGTTVLSAKVSGDPMPSVRWLKNGAALSDDSRISGSTSTTLTLTKVQAGDAGTYAIEAMNAAGKALSSGFAYAVLPRPTQVAVATGSRSAPILNLSTRGIVATGEHVLIAGFVVEGSVPKQVLIRASGLNLSKRFNLTGAIARPQLTVTRSLNGQSQPIAMNDDWEIDATEISQVSAKLGAQPLSSSTHPSFGDAAVLLTLEPGVYSATVAPDSLSANQDGIGLLELYDVNPEATSRLVNISARGLLEPGDRQMIVGVVIGGTGSTRLLMRSVGPTLKTYGVGGWLGNPAQTLFHNFGGEQAVVSANDDWWNSAQTDQSSALMKEKGAFALAEYSPDSVLLRTIEAGVYSTVVSSVDGSSGVVLTEIYESNAP